REPALSSPPSSTKRFIIRYRKRSVWDRISQACLRPRDRFWGVPAPKIDSAFDNLLVPQPSWSPSTTQQL
ncbi:hypothetical protein, partial [Thiolapillus sp.]